MQSAKADFRETRQDAHQLLIKRTSSKRYLPASKCEHGLVIKVQLSNQSYIANRLQRSQQKLL